MSKKMQRRAPELSRNLPELSIDEPIEVEAQEIAEIGLRLPAWRGELDCEYDGRVPFSRNYQVTVNDPKVAEAVSRIRIALRKTNAEQQNGVPVFNNAGTVRWILEQIAESL